MGIAIDARVEGGKLVPIKNIELPEGAVIKTMVDIPRKEKKNFAQALQKLRGTLTGKVSREEWYEQADLY